MQSGIEFSDRFNASWVITEKGFEPVPPEKKQTLRKWYNELGKVLDNPELYDDPVRRIEEIEYLLQSTWGFPENKASHSYWNKIKGCTCPKDDNFFAFGTGVRYYNSSCKWHGEK